MELSKFVFVYKVQLHFSFKRNMAVVQLSLNEICRGCLSRESLEPLSKGRRIETLAECVNLQVCSNFSFRNYGVRPIPLSTAGKISFDLFKLPSGLIVRRSSIEHLLRLLGSVCKMGPLSPTIPKKRCNSPGPPDVHCPRKGWLRGSR